MLSLLYNTNDTTNRLNLDFQIIETEKSQLKSKHSRCAIIRHDRVSVTLIVMYHNGECHTFLSYVL
jgi:hypothetical protein